MTQDQTLPEKAQIGVYEIKAVLSADPFGITYRGWNSHLNAPVTLQEYFPADLVVRQEDRHTVGPRSESEGVAYEAGLASFLEQGKGLAQIEHHSLVRVHNVLEANGTAYLIMDHEDGIPLPRHCDPPASLTEVELKAILLALLEALQKAHESGVVHWDIHPDTIRIRSDGRPVLIGFATARLATASSGGLRQRELRAGYAPAEQYNWGNRPGPATDLYALGATMYRCITHAEPVPAPDRVSALRNGQPDPLGFQVGSLPYGEGLLKAVEWLLGPQLKDRPQSASEVLAPLKAQPEETQATEKSRQQDETRHPRDMSSAMASSRANPWISAGIGVAALTALSFWYFQLLEEGPETVALDEASPLLTDQDKSGPSTKPPKKGAKAPVEIKTPPPKEVAISSQPPSKSESLQTRIRDARGKPVADSATTPNAGTDLARQSPPNSIADSQPDRQATATTVVSEDTIKRHLAAAEEDVAALRLTTPAGDNAYQHYQAVLAIAPRHTQAREGIERIVDQYVWLIRKAVQEGRLDRARVYLNRAEAVSPSAPSLRSLREELAAAER
ncbi:MAG: protein kinase domain-containing protein [Gammaproteobacteria bacterium]